MITLVLIWALTTVTSSIGLILLLAFDEWQVRNRASAAAQRESEGECAAGTLDRAA